MPFTTATDTDLSGAQVTMAEYIDRVRDELEDWDNEDELQDAMNDTQLTFVARDGSLFAKSNMVEIGEETLRISGDPTGNTVPVYRHQRGSQAVDHVGGTRILVHSTWSDAMIRRAVNQTFAAAYPRLYVREVATITGVSDSYDYTLPTDLTQPHQVESVNLVIDTVRKPIFAVNFFGAPMQMRIEFPMNGYNIEVAYTKPFPKLEELTDATTIPEAADELPVLYACFKLIAQKENKRVRSDYYQVVQDERGVQVGAQYNASSSYRAKFDEMLASDGVRMSPPGRIR